MTSFPSKALALAALLLLAAGCCTSPRVLGVVPSLQVPFTATPPVIDGVLDDPAWASAAVIAGLAPALHEVPTAAFKAVPTTVRVLWDAHYLYLGFTCTDPDIYSLPGHHHDDLLYQEDVCEAFIDGLGDGRQFIELQVSPRGVNLDLMYLFTKAAEYTPDMRLTNALCQTDRWKFLEWNMAGLRTAGHIGAEGWSVELAIPAGPIMQRRGSSVFVPGPLRANFTRYDWPLSPTTHQRELLQQNWSPVLFGNPHNSPARMGWLNLVR